MLLLLLLLHMDGKTTSTFGDPLEERSLTRPVALQQ